MKGLLLGLSLGLSGVAVGFVAGRTSAPVAVQVQQVRTQQGQTDPQQAPDDPRELVPLGPQGQGDGQGQRPQPGQGGQPQPGNCTVLQFKNGQFYQLTPGPGQPGQQPGPGGSGPGNGPGGDNELFPVTPVNPGSTPGFPFNSDPVHS